MELIKKLSKIQKELSVPKSQRNNFGNYNYRNCEDILEAVKPLLDNETILTISDEIVMIGDRYYVKATVTLSCDKEEIIGVAFAREALIKKGMDESQITGASSSYARKYALNGLFLIDDTKDADSQDNTHSTVQAPKLDSKAQNPTKTTNPITMQDCEQCGKKNCTPKVAEFSKKKFNQVLCFDCQKIVGTEPTIQEAIDNDAPPF